MTTQSKTKQKSKPKAKRSKPSGEGGAPSSGEEADGLTALKAVEEEEGRGGAKRGQPSASRLHWHPPTKHTEPGSIVQAILVELNEANDPEQDDYYIPNKHIPFHYDPDDDEEVQQMENEEAEEDSGEDDDEEFVELLHMNLEDKELEGVLDSVVDLSEVKKVRIFSNMN